MTQELRARRRQNCDESTTEWVPADFVRELKPLYTITLLASFRPSTNLKDSFQRWPDTPNGRHASSAPRRRAVGLVTGSSHARGAECRTWTTSGAITECGNEKRRRQESGQRSAQHSVDVHLQLVPAIGTSGPRLLPDVQARLEGWRPMSDLHRCAKCHCNMTRWSVCANCSRTPGPQPKLCALCKKRVQRQFDEYCSECYGDALKRTPPKPKAGAGRKFYA